MSTATARPLQNREIVVATHNAGKLAEIRDLISPFGFAAKSAGELGLPEPEETGTTFEENAAIKALAAARATGMPALSDDSGLCVDALDGQPGVYTADWAQKADGSRDFAMAMRNVEEKLQQVGATTPDRRRAAFVAVLALAWPDGHVEIVEGRVEGTCVWPPRGDQGFGYDPMFQPDGHDRTFGEMTGDEKHGWAREEALSHRARAFEKLVAACFPG